MAAGKVNGVQLALDSVFSTLSFVAGIFTWNPGAFKWLMFGSVVVVLSSAAPLHSWMGVAIAFKNAGG